MCYVDPDECIDCGRGLTPCPVDAILPEGEVPVESRHFAQIEDDYFLKVRR